MLFSRFTRYVVSVYLLLVSILIHVQTGWGTRAGIGDPTAATAAADNMKGDTVEKENVQTPSGYPQQHQHELYQQPAVEMQTGYAR